jgi:hypothetical protein
MLWSMEMSSHWVEIDADPDVWVALPSLFPLDRWPDELAWAMEQAEAIWLASGLPHRRKQVKQLVRALMDARAHMAQRASWSHLTYLHLPEPTSRPVFVSVGVWRAQGDRDEALRFYACADLAGTPEAATVEEFATEHLGTGLRVLTEFASEPDGGLLGYAWRVGDHTDLCVTVMDDKARLPEMIPNVDTLVRGIRVVSDPEEPAESDEEPAENDEDGELVLEATSFVQVIGWVEKSLAEMDETKDEE